MTKTKAASKTQAERFVEAARALGTDDSETAFDRALGIVGRAPPAPMPKKAKKRSAKKPAKRRA